MDQGLRASYSLEGAALLLGRSKKTVDRWANGYTFALRDGTPRSMDPILRTDRERRDAINFYELIELLYVRTLLDRTNCTLENLRKIVSALKVQTGSEYPLTFASPVLRIAVGQLVKIDTQTGQMVDLKTAQYLLAYADELAQDLEFEGSRVSTWYLNQEHTVRINPGHRFGQPIVASGTPTHLIFERYQLEPHLGDLVEWFDLPQAEIEAAIRFETEQTQRRVA